MNQSSDTSTPGFATFVDVLRARALHQPSALAYTFLAGDEEQQIAHEVLDRRARAIAAALQHAGYAGERALLLHPPGLEYIAAFLGCLYAGVIAVPAYPPKLNRNMHRIQAIVVDARAKIALTTAQILASVQSRVADTVALHDLDWISTDTIEHLEHQWQPPAIDGATLAFLQYTSGSTSSPKGVMVSHANLLHNSALLQQYFEHSPDSRMVSWLPPYHDMGLILGILQPLFVGFPAILMSPFSFVQHPFRWLEAISRYQATTSGGPNFAYDLCVSKVTPEQRATLDLRSWSLAFNGAEPIRAATLERFAETFAECGFRRKAFYPCYGLAEATLFVSGGDKAAPPIVHTFDRQALERNQAVQLADQLPGNQTLVGCGRALADQQIKVVDPNARIECLPGQIGELWLAGASVPQGYWLRPEETERTFQATLADSGSGPFLRTGDLGFMQDGEVFITGRHKDLVIIRGRNHYPQDIELTVEQSHPALRPGSGAAAAIEVGGEERLIVVQEVVRDYREAAIHEVAGAIRSAVMQQHEVDVYGVLLLRAGSIPKTSSGKIQRHACRQAFLDSSLPEVGRWVLELSQQPDTQDASLGSLTREDLAAMQPEERQQTMERYLARLIGSITGIPAEHLDTQQQLVRLGLDSLKTVDFTTRIRNDLGVAVSAVMLMEYPTAAQIAAYLLDQLIPSAKLPAHASPEEAASLLMQLDQLSPAEMDSLLKEMLANEERAR